MFECQPLDSNWEPTDNFKNAPPPFEKKNKNEKKYAKKNQAKC